MIPLLRLLAIVTAASAGVTWALAGHYVLIGWYGSAAPHLAAGAACFGIAWACDRRCNPRRPAPAIRSAPTMTVVRMPRRQA